MKKSENSSRDLWDTTKNANICIMGVPEREEKVKEAKRVSDETIIENLPNLIKDMNLDI